MIQACIAGMPIWLEGGDPEFFPYRLRDYETPVAKPELSISMMRLPEVPIAEGTELLCRDGILLKQSEDGRLSRYTIGKKSGRVLQCSRSTPDYAEWQYQMYENRTHPTLSMTDFEYLYSGEAFANRLAYLGGLVMHGSSIRYNGKGIVFSAPSGTGKSTHTGLWKQYYGSCVEHINDDKPAIRFDGDIPVVYGTPWSGKTDTNANISAPLHAIVFLEQAPENHIQPLSIEEAVVRIHRETVRPYYDEALGLKVLETTERLIRSVPIFLLQCTISEEAVNLVKNTLNW
ncbi:MAG: hypothetical protein IJP14_07100 [Clostridia bacterium]|nr:hypothetical protein [Clostridia bacterium]